MQLLQQRRAFPKTIGEGLSAIGESLGDIGIMRRLEAADVAAQKEANDKAAKYAALPPASMTDVQNTAPPPSAVTRSLASNASPGKIYENDEPSPLDPPSGADRDAAIRTLVAEAGNQSPEGQNAVASVIRNRAVNGGYGGDTAGAVVQAPNQFEPWNTAAGRARMAAISPNDPRYAAASQALERAYFGNDPTNGAKNFYSPKAQAALGRAPPAWAQGPSQDIGDHRFYGGAPRDAVTQALMSRGAGVPQANPIVPGSPAGPPTPTRVAGLGDVNAQMLSPSPPQQQITPAPPQRQQIAQAPQMPPAGYIMPRPEKR